MTTPPDRTDELLQALHALQESLERSETARGAQAEASRQYFGAIRDRLDAQDKLVQGISDTQDTGAALIDVLGKWNEDLSSRIDGLTGKVDGLRDDIALVRGGHARNAMRQNLPRIAAQFGLDFISEMPQAALIGLSRAATAQGEPANEAESFRNADTVISVLNQDGQPGYVALEASFTVDSNDVRRAMRNADYLSRYTGLSAFAAVAGVNVLPEAQAELDAGRVFLYHILARELQSE